MEKSESIKEIGAALAKFQSEVHNPSNTATNPFFKSKYAPLAEVLNTIRPTLSKNGLSVIQNNYGNGEGVTVTTTLIHSSGEWIKTGELTAKPEKNTAQAMGSIITYLRRYQLSSLLGVSSEDDNDANEKEPNKEEKKQEAKKTQNEQKNPEQSIGEYTKELAINAFKLLPDDKQSEILAKYKSYDDMTDGQVKITYHKYCVYR